MARAEALEAISALSSSVARAELVGRAAAALENAALAQQVDALAFELQGSKIVGQLSAVEEKARADDRDDLRRLALTAEARAKRAEHEGAVECARLHARLHEVDAQREVAEERLRVAAEAQRRGGGRGGSDRRGAHGGRSAGCRARGAGAHRSSRRRDLGEPG